MRLRNVRLRNFRCYADEVSLDLDDFTALIGANDVGKSTFMDALAIFFGEKKVEALDACLTGDKSDMGIICEFDDLPEEFLIDTSRTTSLEAEFLTNENGRLEIHQTYNAALKTPKLSTTLVANHPSAPGVSDLLKLKNNELKTRCSELGVDMSELNQSVNGELREAIRDHVDDLIVVEQPVQVDLVGTKEIFSKILEQLPAFFLFSADRPSTDQDAEAQDPMKAAVKVAIDSQEAELAVIAASVEKEISNLVTKTLDKVRSMAPELADELNPEISPPKWGSVFKIGLTSDSQIPLNKRGSGVRRLILLGFLQAQAEAARLASPGRGTIYAIEEPETSQHPDSQSALLETLREIAEDDGFQVLMTTHTPNLVRVLPRESLRFIKRDGKLRTIHDGADEQTCEMIRQTLGVHPDHDVRVFVGVEGIHDENFLTNISGVIAGVNASVSPLSELVEAGRVIFVPLGGSSLTAWVARLKNLRCSEFHIFDRDNEPPAEPHYKEAADEINKDDCSKAVHTSKRELENYLHVDAITAVRPTIVLGEITDFDDVPYLVAEALAKADGREWENLKKQKRNRWAGKAKKWLNTEAAAAMTSELLDKQDGLAEITSWLVEITELANAD